MLFSRLKKLLLIKQLYMKKRILETLGTFKYNADVQKKFESILDVRFGHKSDIKAKFEAFFSSDEEMKKLLNESDELFMAELKRLDLMNLKQRLIDLKGQKETVVIAYMKALVQEIEQQALFCPSSELERTEDTMFQHLLDGAVYNDELTGLEGISNENLRLVLQSWALYPEFVKHPEKCIEMLDCFAISCMKL